MGGCGGWGDAAVDVVLAALDAGRSAQVHLGGGTLRNAQVVNTGRGGATSELLNSRLQLLPVELLHQATVQLVQHNWSQSTSDQRTFKGGRVLNQCMMHANHLGRPHTVHSAPTCATDLKAQVKAPVTARISSGLTASLTCLTRSVLISPAAQTERTCCLLAQSGGAPTSTVLVVELTLSLREAPSVCCEDAGCKPSADSVGYSHCNRSVLPAGVPTESVKLATPSSLVAGTGRAALQCLEAYLGGMPLQ